MMHRITLAVLCGFLLAVKLSAQSLYTERLEDPAAVYFTREAFGAAGDGVTDDTAALQSAIDAVQERSEYGILYLPEGRYRISDTIYIWKGIRLIGYGGQRPVFILPDSAPGFGGGETKYLFNFVSNRPPDGQPIRPANPGTFYSALSNVNIRLGKGNSAAVAVRSHFAQHCYLARIDFHIESGLAGVEKVGNEIENCRFYGGDYGIITTKPSPSWPFVMVDSVFDGQRIASIRTEEAGLTLLRIQFRNTPTAITVNEDRAEELYLADSQLESISGPALVISEEGNARMQLNVRNVSLRDAPVLLAFRESQKTIEAPSRTYRVREMVHGLQIADLGLPPRMDTSVDLEELEDLPPLEPSDIAPLPPLAEWANLRDFGALGDGETDDTEALREAIAASRAVFLPTGRYRVTDTIELNADTVLIGLSPITTQIILRDYTPAFMGKAEEPSLDLERLRRWGLDVTDEAVLRRHWPAAPDVSGSPKPLLVAPSGGRTILTGIGLDTGGANPSAVALKWMAGSDSMVKDVRFLGGHGTYRADGSAVPVYNENRTADGDYRRRWDSQYASLWVTNGGGGTFKNIWTPSPYAQAGIRISNTDTPGRVYQMSVEHHVRAEMQLKNVANWSFYATQFEVESGEGPNALPLEIEGGRNLLFVNTYLYRVDRMISPFPYGIKIRNSSNLTFRGLHVYSPTKFSFDNTLYDETNDLELRSREVAKLHLSGTPPRAVASRPDSAIRAAGAEVEKLAGGFEFIDATTVDAEGNLYFSDSRWHRIYKWSASDDRLSLVRDTPIAPAALATDASGNLIVLTRAKKLYSFHPDDPSETLLELEPQPAQERPGLTALLPGHRWRDAHDVVEAATAPSQIHYLSIDGSSYVTGIENLRRTFTLRPARAGEPFYLADEFGQKVRKFSVGSDGGLYDPQVFAEEGELDVATDRVGNVYVAAGQVFVYDSNGRQIDLIEVPERPATLAVGGADRKSLFIAARSSLYRLRLN